MKKLFILTAAALVGMASCSKEGPANSDKKSGEEGVGYLAFFLNSDAKTRPAQNGTAAESKINEVEIWIFDADGETPDTETPYLAISAPDFGEFTEDDPGVSEYAPTYDGQYVTKIQVAAGDKAVLVVANAGLGDMEGKTLEEIMATVSTFEFTTGEDSSEINTTSVWVNDDDFEGFVMTGFNTEATVVASTTNTIEVEIYRNVAKIQAPRTEGTVAVTLDQAGYDEVFQKGVANTDPAYVWVSQAAFDAATGLEEGDEGYKVIQAITAADYSFTLDGYAVVNGLPKSYVGFVGTLKDGKLPETYAFDPGYKKTLAEGETRPTYTNEWKNWDAGKYVGYDPDWTEQVEEDGNGATEYALGTRIETNSEALKAAKADISSLGDWTGVYSGIIKNKPFLSANEAVYVYESKPGLLRETAETYEGYNADQVIALIIEGSIAYKGGTPETRYWRVNVREQEAYHIVRNSLYDVLISAIKTPGYSTPWEAEESEDIINKPGDTVSQFVISIVPWDVKLVGNEEL